MIIAFVFVFSSPVCADFSRSFPQNMLAPESHFQKKQQTAGSQGGSFFGDLPLPVEEQVVFYIDLLKDMSKSSAVKKGAAEALGQLAPRVADPEFRELVEQELIYATTSDKVEGEVRRAAAVALGKYRIPLIINNLIANLNDHRISVRQDAARTLAQFKEPLVRKALESAFERETSMLVRVAIARTLHGFDGFTGLRFLLDALHSDEPEVRANAAAALAKIATPESSAAILQALGTMLDDPSALVRMYARKSLFRLRSAGAGDSSGGADGTAAFRDVEYSDPLIGRQFEVREAGMEGKILEIDATSLITGDSTVFSLPVTAKTYPARESIFTAVNPAYRDLIKRIVSILPADMTFVSYDRPPGDLFGFTSPRNHLIGLYAGLADLPVAQLHELLEYVTRVRPEILLIIESLLDPAARVWLQKHEERYEQAGKGDEYLKRKQHYIIRAFTRQTCGIADAILTERIKALSLMTTITDADLQFSISYLQNLNGLLVGLTDASTDMRQRSAQALRELLSGGYIAKDELVYKDIIGRILKGLDDPDLDVSEIYAEMLAILVQQRLIDPQDLVGKISVEHFADLLHDPQSYRQVRSAKILRQLSRAQALTADQSDRLRRTIPSCVFVSRNADFRQGAAVLYAETIKYLTEGNLLDRQEVRKRLKLPSLLDELSRFGPDCAIAAQECVFLIEAGILGEEDKALVKQAFLKSGAIRGLDGSLGQHSTRGAHIVKLFLQAGIFAPTDAMTKEIIDALLRGIRDPAGRMFQTDAELICLLSERGMIPPGRLQGAFDMTGMLNRWTAAKELERKAFLQLLRAYPVAPAERALTRVFVDAVLGELGQADADKLETAAEAAAVISKARLLDAADPRINQFGDRLAAGIASRNGRVRLNCARALAAMIDTGLIGETGKKRLRIPFDQVLAGLDDPGYAYVRVASAQVLNMLSELGLCPRHVPFTRMHRDIGNPLVDDGKRMTVLKGMSLLQGKVDPHDVDILQALIEKTATSSALFPEMIDLMRWFSLNRSSKAQDMLDRHVRRILNRPRSAGGYIPIDERDRWYIEAVGKSFSQLSLVPFIYREDIPPEIRSDVLKSLAERGTIDAEYAAVTAAQQKTVLKIIANVHNELGIVPPYQLTHMFLLGEITPEDIRRKMPLLDAAAEKKDYRLLIKSLVQDPRLLLAYYCLRQAPFVYPGTVTLSFQRFEEILKKAVGSLEHEDPHVVNDVLKNALARAGLAPEKADAVAAALLAGRPPLPRGSPYLGNDGEFIPQPIGSVIIPENASLLKYAQEFRERFLYLTQVLKINQLVDGIRKGIKNRNLVADPRLGESLTKELDALIQKHLSARYVDLSAVRERLLELHGKIYTRPAKPVEQILADGVAGVFRKTSRREARFKQIFGTEQEIDAGVPDIGPLAAKMGAAGVDALSAFLGFVGEKALRSDCPALTHVYKKTADDILATYGAYSAIAQEQDLIVDIPQVVYLDYVDKNNLFEALRFSDGAHSCNTSDPKTRRDGGFGGEIYSLNAHRWLTDATTFFFQVTTRPRGGKQIGWIKCWFGLDAQGMPFVGSNYLYLSPAYKDKRLVKAILKKVEEVLFSLPVSMYAQYGPSPVGGFHEMEVHNNGVKPPVSYHDVQIKNFIRLQSLKDGEPIRDDLLLEVVNEPVTLNFLALHNTRMAKRLPFEKTLQRPVLDAGPSMRTELIFLFKLFGNIELRFVPPDTLPAGTVVQTESDGSGAVRTYLCSAKINTEQMIELFGRMRGSGPVERWIDVADPIYFYLKGWQEEIAVHAKRTDLPEDMRDTLQRLSDYLQSLCGKAADAFALPRGIETLSGAGYVDKKLKQFIENQLTRIRTMTPRGRAARLAHLQRYFAEHYARFLIDQVDAVLLNAVFDQFLELSRRWEDPVRREGILLEILGPEKERQLDDWMKETRQQYESFVRDNHAYPGKIRQGTIELVRTIAETIRRYFPHYSSGKFHLMSVIEDEKANCVGYATMFYLIAKEIGLSVNVTSVKREGMTVIEHAANIIHLPEVNGERSFVLVDVTWNGYISEPLAEGSVRITQTSSQSRVITIPLGRARHNEIVEYAEPLSGLKKLIYAWQSDLPEYNENVELRKAIAEKMLRADKNDFRGLSFLASYYAWGIEEGTPRDSRAAFKYAREALRQRADLEMLDLLRKLAHHLGKDDECEKVCAQLLEDARDIKTFLTVASYYRYSAKDLDRSIAVLLQAINSMRGLLDVEGIPTYLTLLKELSETAADNYRRTVDPAEKKGKLDLALAYLDIIMSHATFADERLYTLYADLLRDAGKSDVFVQRCTELMERLPGAAEPVGGLIYFYTTNDTEDGYQKAVTLAREYLERFGADAGGIILDHLKRIYLGETYAPPSAVNPYYGKKEELMQHLIALNRKFPESLPVLKLLGAVAMERGVYGDAVFYLEQAQQLAPGDIEILILLIDSYAKRGAWDRVLETADAVLDREHDNFTAVRMKGTAFQALGKYLEAAECYKKYIQLEPFFYNYLAYFTEKERVQQALEACEAALSGAAPDASQPRIGKYAVVEELSGTQVKVRTADDLIYHVPLKKVGPVDIPALRSQIQSLGIDVPQYKELLLSMLALLEESPPDLYVYDVTAADVFGFASAQHKMVALHSEIMTNPIALLHELGEYLVNRKDGSLVFTCDRETLTVTLKSGNTYSIPLSGEALAIKNKAPDDTHYDLRAAYRAICGDPDRQLTLSIKLLQDMDVVRRKDAAGIHAIRSMESIADPLIDVSLAQKAVDLLRDAQGLSERDFPSPCKQEAMYMLQKVVVSPSARREVVRYIMDQFFMKLLLRDDPVAQAGMAKCIGEIVYEHNELITQAYFRHICGMLVRAKDRSLKETVFSAILEPLFFKRPELFSAEILAGLGDAYKGQEEFFKYLVFYAQMRGIQTPYDAAPFFEHQQSFKDLMLTGGKEVLVIHNVDDGLGDEIIRNSTLFEALLRANKDLRITVYTRRPFLYTHPRIIAKELSEMDLRRAGRFDMVVDYYAPKGCYTQEAEDQLYRYLDAKFPPLFIRGGAMMWDFNYQTVVVANQPLQLPAYNLGNCYVPSYRLCAELGIPFRTGTEMPREIFFSGVIDPNGKRYWNANIAQRKGDRPVAVMNGFGGELQGKGFYNTEAGRKQFATVLKDIIARDVFVVLLPNDTSWGSVPVLEKVIALLPEQIRENALIAPPLTQNRDLHNYLVYHADLVTTVEGGLMHLAYNLGKPMVIIRMQHSSAFNEWVPAGTDPCQRTVMDPQAAGDGVAQVLYDMRTQKLVAENNVLQSKAMLLKDRLLTVLTDAGAGSDARLAAQAILSAIAAEDPGAVRSALWSQFLPVPLKGDYARDVVSIIEYLILPVVPLEHILPVGYESLIKTEEMKEKGFGPAYADLSPRDKNDLNPAVVGAAALLKPATMEKKELFVWHVDPQTDPVKFEMELKAHLAAAAQIAKQGLDKKILIALEETDGAKKAIIERLLLRQPADIAAKIEKVDRGTGKELTRRVKLRLSGLDGYAVIGANVPVDTIGEYRAVIDYGRLSVLILAVQGRLTIVNIPEFVKALSTKELAAVIEEFKQGGLPLVRNYELKMDNVIAAYEAIRLSA